jgi:hypothetical protein
MIRFLGGGDLGFLKEGVKTNQTSPISPLNSPTLFCDHYTQNTFLTKSTTYNVPLQDKALKVGHSGNLCASLDIHLDFFHLKKLLVTRPNFSQPTPGDAFDVMELPFQEITYVENAFP